MASIIKIKRSGSQGTPGSLGSGELAYSWNQNQLYIGTGTETNGAAQNIDIIGGKYFTDLLDHTAGTLTASSAIIVDASSKIDILNIDHITIDGNTISSSTTNTDINITPDGTGKLVLSNVYIDDSSTSLTEYIQDVTGGVTVAGEGITVVYDDIANSVTISGEDASSSNKGIATFNTDSFSVDTGDVTLITQQNYSAGSFGSSTNIPVVTVNDKGIITDITTASVATSLSVEADAGSGSGSIDLLNESLNITGGEGIDVSWTAATTSPAAEAFFTISGEDASTTNKGIASFSTDNFSVTNGAVSAKTITLGDTTLALGSTNLEVTGLQHIEVDNFDIDGNVISYLATGAETDGDIVLAPLGTGSVSVSNKKITNLANPTQAKDAANKEYVDSVVSGIDPKDSVRVASIANIATLAGYLTIDGILLAENDRVLVKNQTSASENGIYIVRAASWDRAADFNTNTATPGAFVFVEEGTTNADSGWVCTTDGTIVIDTTSISFAQFSGAGQITAGNGLSKTGNALDVNVANGIEISGDNVQLANTVAGDGLTYLAGVINVVGTADRISVAADAIDIASTYAGQTTIDTLGTVTTGTWQATTIAVSYGGTGLTSLTSKGILYGNGTSATGVTAASDIGGTNATTSYGVLTTDNSGIPVWTDVLDGGTYGA